MNLYDEDCSLDKLLPNSIFLINKYRIDNVKKNIPYEEKYLNKKKHFDNLLDLKLCCIKKKIGIKDISYIKEDNKIDSKNGKKNLCQNIIEQPFNNNKDNIDEKEKSQRYCKTNDMPINGMENYYVYFILRQWCIENVYDKIEKKNQIISYVIIGKHIHENNNCFYEEVKVEILNYNVEKDGFFVQIHGNGDNIFLLSQQECILVKNKYIKNNFAKAELILNNKHFKISKKRKIIKGEWFNKSKNIITLLTYEQVIPYKLFTCNYRGIIRLINIKNKNIKEEIKIVLPDISILLQKIQNNNDDIGNLKKKISTNMNKNYENLKLCAIEKRESNDLINQKDYTNFDESEEKSTSFSNKKGKCEEYQNKNEYKYGCASNYSEKTYDSCKNYKKNMNLGFDSMVNYYADDLGLTSTEVNTIWGYENGKEKKQKNISRIRNKKSEINKQKRYLYNKYKYQNLAVDFCFGSINENVLWIETCIFILLKVGIILIYSPIFTKKCYISYPLLYELNQIRIGNERTNRESISYNQEFLEYYNFFENCSICKYEEKYVCIQFDKNHNKNDNKKSDANYISGKESKDNTNIDEEKEMEYIPYVINCLKPSEYKCINLIYYNSLVIICVCSKLGYISFFLLNYFITPCISLNIKNNHLYYDKGNKTKKHVTFSLFKKKNEPFFFNIFNNKENAHLEKMDISAFTNLINKEKYDDYKQKMKNNYIVKDLITHKNEEEKKQKKYIEYCNEDSSSSDIQNEIKKSAIENVDKLKNDKIIESLNKMKKKKKKNRILTEKYKENVKKKKDDELFFSCYEEINEIYEDKIDKELRFEYYILNVLFFDSYYTGMLNVKCIVLNDNNLICFNNNKVIIINLLWLKFVYVIVYLISVKHILSARLMYEICTNSLYMKATIFKSKINFYEFDYYSYLLLDHTKQLCYDNFIKLFKNKKEEVLLKSYQDINKVENFDIFQSNVLYNVQYLLHPVVIQIDDHDISNDKLNEVYFIFTHYINLESQRKNQLFMNKDINFFTCPIYKNIFLIYDCFKFNLYKDHLQLQNKDNGTTTYLVKKKKNYKPFCILGQNENNTKLINYIINTKVIDDDSIDIVMYKNILSFYIYSRCNDYMNELIKKNFIFYIGKKSIHNKTHTNNFIINNNNENDNYPKIQSILNEKSVSKMSDITTNLTNGNHQGALIKYSNFMNMNSEPMLGLKYGRNYNYKNKIIYSKNIPINVTNFMAITTRNLTYSKSSNNLCDNNPIVGFLKNAFLLLYNTNTLTDQTKDKNNNKIYKDIMSKINNSNNISQNFEAINPEFFITSLKHYIKNMDVKKSDGLECAMLIKKLIKIKNDYIHVKDYYLKKYDIHLIWKNPIGQNDENQQMAFVQNIIKHYYFFLGLNNYYENKFKKIQRRITEILSYKIIHFLKSHSHLQNVGKSIIQKNSDLVEDIKKCYEKQKLIKNKFNLLKKKY
ncbi:conserved Plasmodium protein, unknown function [Plasmodium berghei]|uniref:Uncharacterized protein n=2 Tax=Plasmodium berghei TaxID=5821 RepID=A0A509ALY3_PLABA|nr:conserved Plasmodium protein, unknown function [Plasmodium berghei ANKA]CXI17415.1 conserved Plasmodium protein, unknown function [Plasmodium berghei]SCM19699.1 conserved Plasmodium protein, unknown function [Plasmodium berghei]SCN23444.1 conserved Plasmodium protein, unknown function [Plasmodium berghei]SCO59084.1 conserved Plasmodium protein, unknown function [Plasmodium berghei]SCO59730.1 conserved Plasmodium protein, unknown function [Plasmodium berghei]|eukprot:XP_034420597.1 conserved Plasmodium protein, unknown function [Plasmodium berghei ANKA]